MSQNLSCDKCADFDICHLKDVANKCYNVPNVNKIIKKELPETCCDCHIFEYCKYKLRFNNKGRHPECPLSPAIYGNKNKPGVIIAKNSIFIFAKLL